MTDPEIYQRKEGWYWVHHIHEVVREAGPFPTRTECLENWKYSSSRAWYKSNPKETAK